MKIVRYTKLLNDTRSLLLNIQALINVGAFDDTPALDDYYDEQQRLCQEGHALLASGMSLGEAGKVITLLGKILPTFEQASAGDLNEILSKSLK